MRVEALAAVVQSTLTSRPLGADKVAAKTTGRPDDSPALDGATVNVGSGSLSEMVAVAEPSASRALAGAVSWMANVSSFSSSPSSKMGTTIDAEPAPAGMTAVPPVAAKSMPAAAVSLDGCQGTSIVSHAEGVTVTVSVARPCAFVDGDIGHAEMTGSRGIDEREFEFIKLHVVGAGCSEDAEKEWSLAVRQREH